MLSLTWITADLNRLKKERKALYYTTVVTLLEGGLHASDRFDLRM